MHKAEIERHRLIQKGMAPVMEAKLLPLEKVGKEKEGKTVHETIVVSGAAVVRREPQADASE
jgi:hypothetical protein